MQISRFFFLFPFSCWNFIICVCWINRHISEHDVCCTKHFIGKGKQGAVSDKGIHSIPCHAWVHMWKFHRLQEKPYADIIQGWFKRLVPEVYSYIPSWVKYATLNCRLALGCIWNYRWRRSDGRFLLSSALLKYILKFCKHEKVIIIIVDESITAFISYLWGSRLGWDLRWAG